MSAADLPSRGRHVLVLGGQRSGKSRYAEQVVATSGLAPVYLATAQAGDEEMTRRIAAHRERRGAAWHTVEEPLDLAGTIVREAGDGRIVLVECLTLWLSNTMQAGADTLRATTELIGVLGSAKGQVVLVSNEVGSGVIPATPLGRRYADGLGALNQRVAAAVRNVVLVVAGMPVQIKPAQQPEIAW